MISRSSTAGRAIGVAAVVMALAASRYFLDPPPWLNPPESVIALYEAGPLRDAATNVAPYLYENHRALVLTHIGCGIVAILLGLVQFSARIRGSRPRLHRTCGTVYAMAVWAGGIAALPLSLFIPDAAPVALRSWMLPAVSGFVTLSVAWPLVTAVAYVHARRRRFDVHRRWMVRSYALTFSAVTVRLAAPPLLLITGGDVFLSVTLAIWCWPVNLVAAEWILRREPGTATLSPAAAP